MVTHHSQSGIIGAPISISLRELATLIPSSLLPTPIPTTEEVYNQLKMLEDMNCLEEQNRYGYASEYSSFSIKSTGIMLVKKIFGDLSDKVKDRNAYQQAVGSTEGNSETKNWVRGLWDSLKEKAQDEIADEVLSGVKTYGPQLIGFLIRLISQPG